MKNITLWGIKPCDTVRKAKKWLEQNEINFEFSDFRDKPLEKDQLEFWVTKQQWETIFNKRSTSFRNLSDAEKTDINETKAMNLMLEHPTLIKRPILVLNDKVYVGFKIEQYQEIFNS
nr:arsenate reductase [Parashewanella hymeniacidonis]